MLPNVLRERVPFFASAQALSVAPLEGVISLNNANYKVVADGAESLLRIGTESVRYLGIRRSEEVAAARAAAEVGVAPAVLYADSLGVMVTPFLAAKHWGAADFGEPRNVVRLATALRALHSVQDVAATCSVYERIERLLGSVAELNLEPPDNLGNLLRRLGAFRELRERDRRFPIGLCHGDLWANNFLDDGDRLWLIDWEFAGLGDGLYDLATAAMAGNYDAEGQRALLVAYGYSEPEDVALLERMKNVARFFEGAWALVQHGLRGSKDDFDYLGYYQRTFAALTDF